MTTQDTREVFTLVLNSAKTVANGGFVLDNQTNANVLYQINFDSLFQGKNRMYKYAQLRGLLISELVSVTALPNAIGYISIVGFSQKNSLGVVASPIIFNQIPTADSPIISGSMLGAYYYNGFRSTLSSYEAYELCTLPQGIQNIQVQFTSLTDAIQAGGNLGNYNLILQFELYN